MSDAIEKNQTKFNSFVSKKGQLIKFIDFNMPSLETNSCLLEVRVRLIFSGGNSNLFCQLSKYDEYSPKVASIENSDLKDVIKAILTLEKAAEKDLKIKADYVENKYVTEDGFKIGYYVSKGELNWFIVLDEYSDSTEFFSQNIDLLKETFSHANNKMEQIQSSIKKQ